jgi:hypothetical protein
LLQNAQKRDKTNQANEVATIIFLNAAANVRHFCRFPFHGGSC